MKLNPIVKIITVLSAAALLTGRQDFSDRADIYLREGLDISRDGEFAERSTGTYNGVNDDQMIRLYLATGDRLYLEAARSNLEMMLSYFDPDGSVFTFNSTRQDYGQKVWQSYLENDTPKAGRIYWCYGPEKGGITIVGLEPHPEDKSNGYKKVTLSAMGKETT